MRITSKQRARERTMTSGYIKLRSGKAAHRHIYETYHKRKIRNGWVVHHVDMNKKNNHISNLLELPNELHTDLHVYMSRIGRVLTRQEQINWCLPFINARYRQSKVTVKKKSRSTYFTEKNRLAAQRFKRECDELFQSSMIISNPLLGPRPPYG